MPELHSVSSSNSTSLGTSDTTDSNKPTQYTSPSRRSSIQSNDLRKVSSAASYRSTQTGYSVKDIYGDTPETQVNLQRLKPEKKLFPASHRTGSLTT